MKSLRNRRQKQAKKFYEQISHYLFPFFFPFGGGQMEREGGLTLYHFDFWSVCPEGWLRAEELFKKVDPEVYSYIREKRLGVPPTFKVIAVLKGKVYIFGVLGSVSAVQERMNKDFTPPSETPPGLLSAIQSGDGWLYLFGSGIDHPSLKSVPFLRNFIVFLRSLFRKRNFLVSAHFPFYLGVRVIPSESEDFPRVFWFLFNFLLSRSYADFEEFMKVVEAKKLRREEEFIELLRLEDSGSIPCLECGVPVSSPYLEVFCSERCFYTLFRRVERAIKRGDIVTDKRPYAYLNEAIGEYTKALRSDMDRATARSMVRRRFHLEVKRRAGRPPKNRS